MNALVLIRPDVEACADRARIAVEVKSNTLINTGIDSRRAELSA